MPPAMPNLLRQATTGKGALAATVPWSRQLSTGPGAPHLNRDPQSGTDRILRALVSHSSARSRTRGRYAAARCFTPISSSARAIADIAFLTSSGVSAPIAETRMVGTAVEEKLLIR